MLQICLELPEEMGQELKALASAGARDMQELVLEALEHYLTVKRWQMNELNLAFEEAEAGGFASEEEVQRVLHSYRS